MSELADSLFGTVPQDSNSEPIPGLADFLAANAVAQPATKRKSVATKRPTVRQLAVKITGRIPSKPARPAKSVKFWILAITTTTAFPPAILVWLWLMRIPPTTT